MITRSTLSGTLFCIALLAVGCGSPTSSTDKPSAEPTNPAPEPAQTPTTTPAPAEEAQVADAPVATDEQVQTPVAAPAALATSDAPPPAAAPAAKAAKEPPAAAPTPKPSAPAPVPVASAPPPAAPAATSAIADPGGAVAVAPTKPGLERIGAEACGDCHDVQFESWTGGAHAKRTPPLDCEDCHGPGSEYKSKAVMKDSAKAEAAGLVMPDKAFCAKCHKKGVDDAFMEKAHAHEE